MSGTAAARRHGIPWPPVIYVSAIAASVLLNLLYPLPWITAPLSDILFAGGLLLVLGSVALLVSAITTLRRASTTLDPNGRPDHLVTSGPFAISRNPIYLSNAMLMIGVGLISGILWFLILAIVASFAVGRIAVRGEEKVLAERFGKRYHDYAKRVRRWI